MKKAQLIGVSIALGAGLIAFVGMQGFVNRKPKTIVKKETIGATEVLVARMGLSLGTVAEPTNFRWMKWPSESISPTFITRKNKPNAIQEMAGGIARAQILKDEPITAAKLVATGKGGVLAAILPKGKRAISTKITETTAVGRLILPNDHVDVLLTRSARDRNGNETFATDTIFRNIRVLAIGKQLDIEKKEEGADGNVATLELTPRQTEMLAQANSMGAISLALRSVADINTDKDASASSLAKKDDSSSVRVLRYGVKGRVFGVN
ncbi:MAG: Flp pilus assembly protein CpaB [Hyphomicrobiaceae bacterium]